MKQRNRKRALKVGFVLASVVAAWSAAGIFAALAEPVLDYVFASITYIEATSAPHWFVAAATCGTLAGVVAALVMRRASKADDRARLS